MSRDITVEPVGNRDPRPTHYQADQGRPRGVGLIGPAGSTSGHQCVASRRAVATARAWERSYAEGHGSACAGWLRGVASMRGARTCAYVLRHDPDPNRLSVAPARVNVSRIDSTTAVSRSSGFRTPPMQRTMSSTQVATSPKARSATSERIALLSLRPGPQAWRGDECTAPMSPTRSMSDLRRRIRLSAWSRRTQRSSSIRARLPAGRSSPPWSCRRAVHSPPGRHAPETDPSATDRGPCLGSRRCSTRRSGGRHATRSRDGRTGSTMRQSGHETNGPPGGRRGADHECGPARHSSGNQGSRRGRRTHMPPGSASWRLGGWSCRSP